MNYTEFENLVIKAIDELPEFFRKKMQNVAVVIEEAPSEGLKQKLGQDRNSLVLGLYQGVPLNNRSSFQGMIMPEKITIYKRNIERVAKTEAEIKEAVQHTVQHEIAHHFGITDQQLRDMGVY